MSFTESIVQVEFDVQTDSNTESDLDSYRKITYGGYTYPESMLSTNE